MHWVSSCEALKPSEAPNEPEPEGDALTTAMNRLWLRKVMVSDVCVGSGFGVCEIGMNSRERC